MERNRQSALPLVLVAVAVLLIGARVTSLVLKPKTTPSLVRWVSLEEAAQLALSSNKLLLLDFTADWCLPCHELDREVFNNAAIAQFINDNYIAVRIVDRQQEEGKNSAAVEDLQRRFHVDGFPTVVFADASGVERARLEGFRSREDFERVMERAH